MINVCAVVVIGIKGTPPKTIDDRHRHIYIYDRRIHMWNSAKGENGLFSGGGLKSQT